MRRPLRVDDDREDDVREIARRQAVALDVERLITQRRAAGDVRRDDDVRLARRFIRDRPRELDEPRVARVLVFQRVDALRDPPQRRRIIIERPLDAVDDTRRQVALARLPQPIIRHDNRRPRDAAVDEERIVLRADDRLVRAVIEPDRRLAAKPPEPALRPRRRLMQAAGFGDDDAGIELLHVPRVPRSSHLEPNSARLREPPFATGRALAVNFQLRIQE